MCLIPRKLKNSMESDFRKYEVGAAVRVTRGSLAGITGVVVETRGHRHCVISADFWANGVKLVLDSDDLEQVRRNRQFALI